MNQGNGRRNRNSRVCVICFFKRLKKGRKGKESTSVFGAAFGGSFYPWSGIRADLFHSPAPLSLQSVNCFSRIGN